MSRKNTTELFAFVCIVQFTSM